MQANYASMAKQLFTDRLILRPIDVNDAPELCSIRSHEEVYQHMLV